MIIRIKNKNEIAIARMIRECREKGGTPDYIELTPQEALNILKELHSCEGGYPEVFKIDLDSEVRFIINSPLPITTEQANKVINQWIREEFSILYKSSFDEIPLKVIYKPQTPAELPEIDETNIS